MLECDVPPIDPPHTPPVKTPQLPVAAGLARGSDLARATAGKPCCYVDQVLRATARTAASTSTANPSAPAPIKNSNR